LKVIECAKVLFCFISMLDVTGLLLATAVFKAGVLACCALQRNKELLPFQKIILPQFSVSDIPNKGF